MKLIHQSELLAPTLGVLYKVLHGEALPQGPASYPFNHFDRNGTPFERVTL